MTIGQFTSTGVVSLVGVNDSALTQPPTAGQLGVNPNSSFTMDVLTVTTLNTDGYSLQSVQEAITAHAGGGQASATQLTAALCHITVCATATDSVKLPVSVAGMSVFVRNDGAKNAQVFGTDPDTINGVATGTGVALTAAASATYRCTKDGTWFT